jgi:Cytochrome P460
MKKLSHMMGWVLVSAVVASSAGDLNATQNDGEQPRFTAEGKLIRPANYREWVTIGTGLNMAYGPLRDAATNGHPPFTNVFVSPNAYRSFLRTGTWPDQTMFVLEIRASVPVNKATTGNNGYFQGELLGIEAEVKDERRFAGKWAFFGLDPAAPAGAQIPATASCYGCHAKNAAVENTFVQFYPVLRDVARKKGTLKEVAEVF